MLYTLEQIDRNCLIAHLRAIRLALNDSKLSIALYLIDKIESEFNVTRTFIKVLHATVAIRRSQIGG